MSLRYLSRTFVRMAQQVMREHASKPGATFKAPSSQPGAAAAKARQTESQVMMKRSAVPATARGSASEAAVMRRKAEKDENVMHLVCWGPN